MIQTQTYKVLYGGLMRCCVATLDEEMAHRGETSEPLMVEGETLRCKWCKDEYGMICRTCEDGILRWQWAKPEDR